MNDFDMINSILDHWTEGQFAVSFTKHEREQMNPLEVLEKKLAIKKAYIKHTLDGNLFPDIIANFQKHTIVEGDYYPDNYICGMPVSNK